MPEEKDIQADIDKLLQSISQEKPKEKPAPQQPTEEPKKLELPEFEKTPPEIKGANLELLKDVPLNVRVELGKCEMKVEDVLKLAPGSVIEVDKLTGDPLDIYVNNQLVARGEVLVINDNFAIRIKEIISKKERG
jgi:flagellar motor switch protein FliN/FliY